ncbi:MAG: endonuclease [Muribaculaceae bacterium]
MKRVFSTMAACLLTAAAAIADAPAGYYSSLDGKSGESLKTQLHDIIAPHTQLTYNSLWNYFPQTDAYPEQVNGKLIVWDMYSDNWNTLRYFYYGGTGGLNREHSVPKSWWGNSGSSASDIEKFLAGTDIMHLFPSDGSANSAKSNYPLGVVDVATYSNGVSTVGYPVTGQGGGSSRVFEPDDEYKGDFARVYFYMATCYQDYTWKYTYMFIDKSSSYLSLKPWAYNMLLEWARQDPVSQKEIDRNDAVYRIQGNRNPFVDDPMLMEYIWGNRQGQTYAADHPTGDPELISPVQDSELDFGEVAIGSSQYVDLLVKGINLTGSVSVTIYRDDAAMFKSQVKKIPATNANTDEGYKLRITYTPTAIGEHKTRLVVSDGGLTGSVGVSLKASCLAVPSLSQLTANPATDVTETGYHASWSEATEDIDFYVLTRTVYSGNSATTSEFQIDEASYDFDDLHAGETHTYSVQSSRLGYRSVASNVVTVTASGVTGIEGDKRLVVASYPDGVVRIICSEKLANCRIYDAQGRIVEYLPTVEPGQLITLPLGVYIITVDGMTHPARVVVRK